MARGNWGGFPNKDGKMQVGHARRKVPMKKWTDERLLKAFIKAIPGYPHFENLKKEIERRGLEMPPLQQI